MDLKKGDPVWINCEIDEQGNVCEQYGKIGTITSIVYVRNHDSGTRKIYYHVEIDGEIYIFDARSVSPIRPKKEEINDANAKQDGSHNSLRLR